jgi:ribonuclease BN (tRNA processing enzyme)
MQAALTPRIGLDDIPSMLALLKPYRRILLWGEMGIGKSTLALKLLPHFAIQRDTCLLLELDPGSPPFGVPGAICIGISKHKEVLGEYMLPVCTLNSARFRLPLILAARKLMVTAKKRYDEPTFLIDPPGVVRGVGGAELLTALAESLEIDAILVLCRAPDVLLMDELAALSSLFFTVAATSAAREPTKTEKVKRRTRLWDDFLTQASEELCDLQELNIIGTPPPRDISEAWRGKQLALLDKAGEPVAMGEVLVLENDVLTVKVVRSSPARPSTLLIRDAGRNDAGHLVTITHQSPVPPHPQVPVEMDQTHGADDHRSPPLSNHMGPAWATLVGGVFGDPLLHVRLRNMKRSFLFDLGDPARLQAKMAHQVDAVFLSHAHLDHISGFIWFLRSRIGPFGPCKIFGPEGTIQRIENFLQAITWDRIGDSGPVFEVAEIEGRWLTRARLQPGKETVSLQTVNIQNGIILADDSLNIRAEICDHDIPSVAYALEFVQEISIRRDRLSQLCLPPGPWLAYLKHYIVTKRQESVIILPDGSEMSAGELAEKLTIIRPGKKLVYVADMADTAENRRKVINLAQGAHTLFCEAAFAKEDRDKAAATQHLTTSATAQIAFSAGVRFLIPFHFSKRYELNPHKLYEELRAEAGNVQVIGTHT